MADSYAVKLATDFLDSKLRENHEATLVEMLFYADAYGKLVLSVDEVNEALNQRPSVYVERRGGRIVFSAKGTERSVSPEDHEENCKAYSTEFWEKFRLLQMVRPVHPHDAPSIAEIYKHYILNSPVTFEEVPVSADEMRQRIFETTQSYPWLVLEEDGKLLGYCYARKWRERAAYRHSVEVSTYLDPSAVGKGRGSALLGMLLAKLRYRDVHSVIGGVSLPNDASVTLLEKFGFRPVAQFKEVGNKFGQWIDVGYWQLLL